MRLNTPSQLRRDDRLIAMNNHLIGQKRNVSELFFLVLVTRCVGRKRKRYAYRDSLSRQRHPLIFFSNSLEKTLNQKW